MDADASESVALICEGLSGPGRAITGELLRRGWRVAVQTDGEKGEALATDLAGETGAGERLAVFNGSLAAEAQREEVVEFVLDQFARVDLLVGPPPPGAGVGAVDLLEIAPAAVAEALEAGVITPLFLAQRVANEMIRLTETGVIDGGRIVLLGSLAAYTTSPDQACRCLTAAGVSMLVQLFADRLGDYAINVYELRTGLMAGRADQPGHKKYDHLIDQGLTPIRRWGRPHDLALAVGAIAEGALPFSTGEVIHVDGGFHLRRL